MWTDVANVIVAAVGVVGSFFVACMSWRTSRRAVRIAEDSRQIAESQYRAEVERIAKNDRAAARETIIRLGEDAYSIRPGTRAEDSAKQKVWNLFQARARAEKWHGAITLIEMRIAYSVGAVGLKLDFGFRQKWREVLELWIVDPETAQPEIEALGNEGVTVLSKLEDDLEM